VESAAIVPVLFAKTTKSAYYGPLTSVTDVPTQKATTCVSIFLTYAESGFKYLKDIMLGGLQQKELFHKSDP
jgi:hypothetical protein